MLNEKALTSKIIKQINSKYKDTTWLYKRYAIGNEIGKPDITGIHCGFRVEIEVKAPSLSKGSLEADQGLASKVQAHYLKKFRQLGGIAGVVTSVSQVEELLNGNVTHF